MIVTRHHAGRTWENGGGEADVVQWDAMNLPLRSGCIDSLVADLPFGKRCGTHAKNIHLYPAVLAEAGQVLRSTNCSPVQAVVSRAVLDSANKTK